VRGAAARPRPPRWAGLRGTLGHPELGRAFSINFLLVFWFAGMEQTFRLFTDDAFHMSVGETGRFLGLVGVAAIIVQGGLIGRLTRRFGEVRLLITGLLVQTVGFTVLGASPRFAAPRVALALACVLIAGGSGLVTPSVSSYVSRRAGADAQGRMLGTLQSLSALARVLGPAVGGLLYQTIAPGAPYFTGAAGMAIAAALAVGLPAPPPRAR
jgi:MFS transporter, DHA1 family, tetracycline resistance protein